MGHDEGHETPEPSGGAESARSDVQPVVMPASQMTLEERLYMATEIAKEMMRRHDELATSVRTFLYDVDAHVAVGEKPLELTPHMWMQVQAFRNLVA